MNSRGGICCRIIEAALWVDDLLKNEIAEHPLDHPQCSLIYFLGSFVILHNTIIENTSKTQFLKSNGESDQSQGWVSIYTYRSLFNDIYVTEQVVHVQCNIETTRQATRRLLSALHEEGTKMTQVKAVPNIYMKAPKRKTLLLP